MIRSQKELKEVTVRERELSSEESLISTSHGAISWFSANRTIVFTVLGVLVAAVAGYFYWNAAQEESAEKANTALSRIVSVYQMGDWRKAIDGDKQHTVQGEPVKGLKEIVDLYGSTTAGEMAKVYLANSYYYLGKLDSAKTAFESVSGGQSLVKASVEAGKATIFAEKGNKLEAAKLFSTAASLDKTNPMNADYTLAAAKNFEQVGKKDEAVKAYKQLLEEYPGTVFDDAAKRALIKLDVEL